MGTDETPVATTPGSWRFRAIKELCLPSRTSQIKSFCPAGLGLGPERALPKQRPAFILHVHADKKVTVLDAGKL